MQQGACGSWQTLSEPRTTPWCLGQEIHHQGNKATLLLYLHLPQTKELPPTQRFGADLIRFDQDRGQRC